MLYGVVKTRSSGIEKSHESLNTIEDIYKYNLHVKLVLSVSLVSAKKGILIRNNPVTCETLRKICYLLYTSGCVTSVERTSAMIVSMLSLNKLDVHLNVYCY